MANTFKNKLERQIGTSLTAIESYTVPASTETTVIGLTVSNTSAATIEVDVTVNDATNDYYVVKTAPVPSGGSLVVVGGDQKLVLTTGDSVKVKSDTATSADVVMSILEIT
tara:strand:- start:19 stop:351 length:333 start_codon:yes stop_codon:yes gene_type:complete